MQLERSETEIPEKFNQSFTAYRRWNLINEKFFYDFHQ